MLSLVKMDFVLGQSFENFLNRFKKISVFITLETPIANTFLDKKDLCKKSSLYKQGSKYDFKFWKGINLLILLAGEQNIL